MQQAADSFYYDEPLPAGLLSQEAIIMFSTDWSWPELMETPERVVDEFLILQRGQAEAKRRRMESGK